MFLVPIGKDQRDRMKFFHTWSNLSTLKARAHQLNRCWDNFSYVGHEFRFFGSLETLQCRSHLAGPILCSPLLQRRLFPDRYLGIILRSKFRRVFQEYCKYSIWYFCMSLILWSNKSPVWESVETLLFLQIYGEGTVGKIECKVAVLVYLSCLLISLSHTGIFLRLWTTLEACPVRGRSSFTRY